MRAVKLEDLERPEALTLLHRQIELQVKTDARQGWEYRRFIYDLRQDPCVAEAADRLMSALNRLEGAIIERLEPACIETRRRDCIGVVDEIILMTRN